MNYRERELLMQRILDAMIPMDLLKAHDETAELATKVNLALAAKYAALAMAAQVDDEANAN